MKFFIDTAKVEEIKEAASWGILDGVTTNPTHIAASGRKFMEVVEEICSIVDGPISVEVGSTTVPEMAEEARRIARIHKNIVVKIPVTVEGIKAMHVLREDGIRINATLNFSPAQALIAAKVGAAYISPFVGRLDEIGHDGMELVHQIREIYDNYGYKTEIIVAAARTPLHVLEAALAGAEITTMCFDIMRQLFDHPMTDAGLAQFLKDWEKVPK